MKQKKNGFKEKYGPWALVAGASEGLGAAFAESLAARGMNLILLARRENLLKNLARNLEKEYGIAVRYHSVDLGDLPEVRKLMDSTEEEIGLLLYNAAYAPIGLFSSREADDLLRVTDINIRAPLFLTRYLAGKMEKRGKGGILLMSSLAGFQGGPGLSVYSASKAFNRVLAEGLWAELNVKNIDVLASCAGAVRTPGYSAAAGRSGEAPGTMDPSDVAEKTLDALGRGPVFIPGRLNRFFRFILGNVVSRKQAIRIMEKNTKDLI